MPYKVSIIRFVTISAFVLLWLFILSPDHLYSVDNNDSVNADKIEQVYDKDSFIVIDDEFSEFSEFSDTDTADGSKCSACPYRTKEQSRTAIFWVLGSLAFTILAGVFVRFKQTRHLRVLFLIAAIIVLGFYRGGCPCPIMSFQNTILMSIGTDISWQQVIWFVALVPITYLLGKVWCGWICHLGALQEFIFMPGRISILQSVKAQKIMRVVRIVLMITLIVQLIISRSNYFVKIDPFKVAFNLFSSNITGYVLLALLLLSSIFIYRPFCKMACPIGLVLGWISKIPGAAVIGVDSKYKSCDMCSAACKIRAITKSHNVSTIDNQECIACGECIDACPQTGLKFTRGKKINKSVVLCNNRKT